MTPNPGDQEASVVVYNCKPFGGPPPPEVGAFHVSRNNGRYGRPGIDVVGETCFKIVGGRGCVSQLDKIGIQLKLSSGAASRTPVTGDTPTTLDRQTTRKSTPARCKTSAVALKIEHARRPCDISATNLIKTELRNMA